MKKILIAILIVSAVLIWTQKPKERSSLIVGTNAEFPPFTFWQEGKIVGFDIDIAMEVARRLGKNMEFKDMPFDTLLPDLFLDRVDFIAAGMSITEERAKRVLFTKPYLKEDPLVILTRDLPLQLEDLIGKTVIVNDGFSADFYLSKKEGIHLVRLPTTADGFIALQTGRADAFITASTTVRSFYEVQKIRFKEQIIPGTAETCALVISKKYPDLLVEIQKALDGMEKDGTLTQLKIKWRLL